MDDEEPSRTELARCRNARRPGLDRMIHRAARDAPIDLQTQRRLYPGIVMQRLILRPGVEPERAAEVLRSLALGAREAKVAGHEWYQVRDAYLRWVERVESQLPALTSDLALIAAVQTEHYWRFQDAAAKFARPHPMITAELDRQHDRFDALAHELE